MIDLTSEIAGLWAALGPASGHRGRVIQFAAANSGEGVSIMAREFARLAAVRARRPVWLIDGDLTQQSQLDAVSAQPDRFGRLGSSALASPDGSIFYAVSPALTMRDGRHFAPARLLTARPCLGGRLWVSRFRMETLRSDQRIEAVSDPRYWDALRKHADTVVIDAPALDRSSFALTIAPFVDTTVLVVSEGTAASDAVGLRNEIEAVGGRLAGVVVNRSTYRPPAAIRRMTG